MFKWEEEERRENRGQTSSYITILFALSSRMASSTMKALFG